jgi:hypothetical protein
MTEKKTWRDKGIDSLAANPVFDGKIIVKNILPQKMSEVLLDFAKPLLDETDPFKKGAFQAILKTAILVWNYSIMKDNPESFSKGDLTREQLDAMIALVFSAPVGKEVLRFYLERKKSLYPDNKHCITDFDLKWDEAGSAFHLTVMTTV